MKIYYTHKKHQQNGQDRKLKEETNEQRRGTADPIVHQREYQEQKHQQIREEQNRPYKSPRLKAS